jgi:hypothetical protein
MKPSNVSRYLFLDILRSMATLSVFPNHWKNGHSRIPEALRVVDREGSPLYGTQECGEFTMATQSRH